MIIKKIEQINSEDKSIKRVSEDKYMKHLFETALPELTDEITR